MQLDRIALGRPQINTSCVEFMSQNHFDERARREFDVVRALANPGIHPETRCAVGSQQPACYRDDFIPRSFDLRGRETTDFSPVAQGRHLEADDVSRGEQNDQVGLVFFIAIRDGDRPGQEFRATVADERELPSFQGLLSGTRHPPPYNAFRGAPDNSAASFAAVDGGRWAPSNV